MVSATLLLTAAIAPLASAHFNLEYPVWRANTLESGTNYSQWNYPCKINPSLSPQFPPLLPTSNWKTHTPSPSIGAGVPPATSTSGNRTDWPLKGGSVKLDLHHPWEYLFINLGLGANVTNFNYTLTGPTFWNVSGAGTLCVDLPLPEGLTMSDGQEGSIQVVTVGASGSALYNVSFPFYSAPGRGKKVMSGKENTLIRNDNSAPISHSAPTPRRCRRMSVRLMIRCRLFKSRGRAATAPKATRAQTTRRVVLRSFGWTRSLSHPLRVWR